MTATIFAGELGSIPSKQTEVGPKPDNTFQEIVETPIQGCFLFRPWVRVDNRGKFVKTFHAKTFESLGLETDFRENFYSVSQMNVLRGLHFQRPPYQHTKLVHCLKGKIFDVVVDLRSQSPTFGKHITFNLSSENAHILYLCPGLAHGFLALSKEAITLYSLTKEYSPVHDSGVRWDSCGIRWPIDTPITSDRDAAFAPLFKIDPIF